MRKSDLLILPSIEEGFGLVIAEAMGSGCVPLASEACTDICGHMKTGMVHRVGDVDAMTEQLTLLDKDRDLLQKLRIGALEASPEITWTAAGRKLLSAYEETVAEFRRSAEFAQSTYPSPSPAHRDRSVRLTAPRYFSCREPMLLVSLRFNQRDLGHGASGTVLHPARRAGVLITIVS